MRTDSVFSPSAVQAHLIMLLASGISLALSIQPATQIAALRVSALAYSPAIFPVVTTLSFGLFSVSRGAAIAGESGGRIVRSRLVLRVMQSIAFGLLALLPFYLFSRSLLLTRAWGVLMLVSHALLLGLFVALASFYLETQRVRERRSAFLLRYGFYLAFCLVPFALGTISGSLSVLLSLSPIGFAIEAIHGLSPTEALLGYLVPCSGLVWVLMRLQRLDRRHHAI